MAFEQFKEKDNIKRYYKGMPVAMASIFVNQVLAFNKCATLEFLNDSEYKYVQLFFDKETNRVGIKPLIEKEENAYLLQRNYTKHYVGCHLKGFFNSLMVRPKKALMFRLEKDTESGLLFFHLDKPLRKIKSRTMKQSSKKAGG